MNNGGMQASFVVISRAICTKNQCNLIGSIRFTKFFELLYIIDSFEIKTIRNGGLLANEFLMVAISDSFWVSFAVDLFPLKVLHGIEFTVDGFRVAKQFRL